MKGSQTPRIQIEPPYTETDGTGASLLMQAYGVQLYDWQQTVVNAWLAKNAAGEYLVTSAGLSVGRQNGKNVCLEAVCLYGLLINGERILWTSHQARTSRKAFRRLASIFTDKRHPEVVKSVKQIRNGFGEESIELSTGGMIEFASRSRQGGRGFDALSRVVFDEAQELQPEQQEALMAVLSASATGTRQLIYVGTAPYPGCKCEVFRRLRQTAITTKEPEHITWHEWSVKADSLEDIDLSDRRLWYSCNPSLGYRLTEEFTEEEYKTLNPDGFARERLNWWSKPLSEVVDYAIDPKIWDACKSEEAKPEGKTAYGVKFSIDGSAVALAGCVIPENGKARISLINMKSTGQGLSWLANWLNERYKTASCVVIDGKNGADVLIDKIRPGSGGAWAFKDAVLKPRAADVIAAVGMLINDLNEQNITWYAGQEVLRESAISSTKRPISGGWGFGGPNSAPIEAASLALWGCRTSKRNPQRKMLIG